jgi:hypothetical protein
LQKQVIEDFQKIGKLGCIALDLSFVNYHILEMIGQELLAQTTSIQLNSMTFGYPGEQNSLERIMLCSGEEGADESVTTTWPALTKLFLNNCMMINIDVGRLANFFPRLETLHIRPFPYRTAPVILTDGPFCTMTNIRVLKLDGITVHSFKIIDGGCMPNLEEMDIRLADDDKYSLTCIDSFPHFPQLNKLTLYLERVERIHPTAFDHLTQLKRLEIRCTELKDDTFETGVAACFMSFHVTCKVLKLTSSSISNCEEIEIFNYHKVKTTKLETIGSFSELKKLTSLNWANEDLPFHQMTNLEFLSFETDDLSIASSGKLKCLSKLRVLVVNRKRNAFYDSSMYFFFI